MNKQTNIIKDALLNTTTLSEFVWAWRWLGREDVEYPAVATDIDLDELEEMGITEEYYLDDFNNGRSQKVAVKNDLTNQLLALLDKDALFKQTFNVEWDDILSLESATSMLPVVLQKRNDDGSYTELKYTDDVMTDGQNKQEYWVQIFNNVRWLAGTEAGDWNEVHVVRALVDQWEAGVV